MSTFIDRPDPKSRVLEALRVHPAAALLGPRQCGKTTLARMIAADRSPTLRVALEDLKLKHLWVLYPEDQPYDLDKKMIDREIIDDGVLSFTNPTSEMSESHKLRSDAA